MGCCGGLEEDVKTSPGDTGGNWRKLQIVSGNAGPGGAGKQLEEANDKAGAGGAGGGWQQLEEEDEQMKMKQQEMVATTRPGGAGSNRRKPKTRLDQVVLEATGGSKDEKTEEDSNNWIRWCRMQLEKAKNETDHVDEAGPNTKLDQVAQEATGGEDRRQQLEKNSRRKREQLDKVVQESNR